MLTDYHCHILPGIDDGAYDVDTSLAMIETMKEQGVERIIATPHFYAHEERSLTEYLIRREIAYESIADFAAVQNIMLGAEIAIEHGISKIHGIDRLAVEDTGNILLELPFRDLEDWMLEEIDAIASEYGLTVILAHVHRYLEYYSAENMEKLLKTDAVFQFNNEAFLLERDRDLLKQLIDDKKRIVFGSDAHNMGARRPNWDMLLEECDPEILEASNDFIAAEDNSIEVLTACDSASG
ncbi:CpsB/CapC family capsule biosynthesis tyrosine phosphatase [Ruminococcus sp.]|uniref:CpsB/CapC family capsule biosynthesis tyrosine phosphatase n=1 Tax=Ruminococcus sp. TaxID=41978 RepID=UPI002C8BD67A|nr:CpsB/CapC family capsule biosynthesis tyrosine phosphatase [Ruminococcus sp.]HNZ99735.1 capsular polysaccharide biosynthesis protein [Ruminococcus sp.]HOH87072.1 capsular polysaccharide biosynthesis protein [Ruminococcus sp.]